MLTKRPPRSLLLASSCLMIGTLASAAHADSVSEIEEVTEVVVTASGFQQKIEQAPASISVITRKDLQSERHQSLAEALVTVEGVDIGTASKTGGYRVNIRGMGPNYTLFLVDGRRQNAAGNVTPNGFNETATSFMPPASAIERIEVVRGPVSTLYGSDAIGGVVNIITRKVGDVWTGSFTLDGTAQENDEFGNVYGGSFYAAGPLLADKLGLSINGRKQEREQSSLTYAESDGTRVPVTGFGKSTTKYDQWTLGARLSFTPNENHDIWLDYDTGNQWYDNKTGQMGTVGAAGGYDEFLEFNRDQVVLAHNWRLSFGEIQSTLSHVTTENIGRLIPSGVPDVSQRGKPRKIESTSTVFDTKFQSSWRNHNYTIGAQYWDAEMIEGLWPTPFEHQQWAVFAEDEWRFTDTLALTLGARLDDHNVFGQHTSPRAYLVWNATNNWTLKGGVSQGFKTPNLDELAPGVSGVGSQGRVPLVGTPTLKPETSTSTEFAVFYDNRRDFRANLTFYHNKFEDKIASSTESLINCSYGLTQAQYEAGQRTAGCNADYGWWLGAPPRGVVVDANTPSYLQYLGQKINIEEVETQGVEASFRYLIDSNWSLSGNYTYTDTETGDGQPYEGAPPKHLVNGSVRFNATENLNLWLRGEYRSSLYRSNDVAGTNMKALYGDYRAYGQFHLGGSYRFNERVSVNAAIYNIFDKDFVIYKPHATSSGQTYSPIYANNLEGRRLWLSLTTTF